MIIVKLWGGLGNQMFQYSFGKALAEHYNEKVFFDTAFYNSQPDHTGKRKVEIDSVFSLENFSQIDRPRQVKLLENKYFNHIISNLPKFRMKLYGNVFFVKEFLRHYIDEIPYKKGFINYYDGYWLSERYFISIKELLRKEFVPKPDILKDVVEYNSDIDRVRGVSVHIRRGDYTKKINMPKGYNEELLKNYYFRALRYMKAKLENPIFYFFSDDIEWCKRTFGLKNQYIFLSRNTPNGAIVDLFGISFCKNGIMSPSTFSWWGNWLREPTDDGIVILPKGNYSNNYFARSGWIKL